MSFLTTSFPFNATRTIRTNAQLGIFSAADYSTTYGTGGDDTAAVQAALSAASAAGGGVAFLPPPVSGSVNISRTPDALAQGLNLGNNGVFLIGASPTVTVTVIPGSNLDWLISTGTHNAVDYRTVFSVNYVSRTIASNVYTVYNAASQVSLSSRCGIANIRFVGDTSTVSNLGHCIMLNGASGFRLSNVSFSGFSGENVSLWDCYGTELLSVNGSSLAGGRHIAIHRACYETQVVAANTRNATISPLIVYTEQFQIPSGPLLTLSPLYSKFVDTHVYTATALAQAVDLEGTSFVNFTSCTFDGPSSLYSTGTRYGQPTSNVLADTGASSGVVSVGVTTPVTNTGTSTAPIIGLIAPGSTGNVLTSNGSTWVSQAAASGGVTAVTASGNIASSGGATPNITFTGILGAAAGGTGIASPGTTGNVLTSNGTAWVSSPASGGSPRVAIQQMNDQPYNNSSGTINLPYTAVAGNLLVAFGIITSGTINVPTGWTSYQNTGTFFIMYRTATGTTGDQFNYTSSSLTGISYCTEFKNGSTPYGYATSSTGPYIYKGPQITTTGVGMVILFWNSSDSNSPLIGPGWTQSYIYSYGTSRNMGIAWQSVPSALTVSGTITTSDGATRSMYGFAI